MGDQNSPIASGESQNFQVRELAQASRSGGPKINLRLAAKNSCDNIFIEIGVCLEAYLHILSRWLTFSIFLDSSSFL